MSDMSELHFAHFEVRRNADGAPWELGRGAMGVTYKAFDTQLRVEVALKVINPAQVGDAKARALFLREARAAAQVHHSNVGRVAFLNPDPENMFYAMEFIAGESLRDWLHPRVPLNPLMAVGLALQIARGLEAIHREGVIHRDLKPANLMVLRTDKQRKESDPEAWQIKIVDFGLARNIAGEVSETSAIAGTTGFRGTALYASPEQCEERRDLDGRSDLYSLGCVMWEMLVGAPPFRANVHRELLNAHVAKPPPLQQLSNLPTSLQAVVARLLIKDREARFADAGAVIRALEKCREQIARGESDVAQLSPEPASLVDATTVMPAGSPSDVVKNAALRRRLLLAVVLAGVVAMAATIAWRNHWFDRASETNINTSKWDAPVIGILPVAWVDGNADEQKFADVLTNELINRVAQLPGVRVIPRGAVMAYRTVPGGAPRKRVRTINQELGGVSAVLETSIDRQGDEIKIQSVLYNASTEQRLWGQSFQRDWRSASEIAKEVPEQVTRQLRTRLAAAKRENPDLATPGTPMAADLFFEALPMDPFDKRRQDMMTRVAEMDPKFADAISFSTTYDLNVALTRGTDSPEKRVEILKTVDAKNRQALAVDPDCVQAMLYLSMQARGQSGGEADKFLRRAFELAPNDMNANIQAAFSSSDNPAQAYAYARRAHMINPEFRRIMFFLLWRAQDFNLSALADRWLMKIRDLTRDVQQRELIECQQLIVRKDYAGAIDRLRLLPPDLELDFFHVPQLMYDALVGAGRFEEALGILDKSSRYNGPRMKVPMLRAELLLRSGRKAEARDSAAGLLESIEKDVGPSRIPNEPVVLSHTRLAKVLEILGRQDEAVAQLDKALLESGGAEWYSDTWIFRNNPAALDRLAKIHERSDAIARRILGIEKEYGTPVAASENLRD
ncbi:hypothetical protein AYO41_03425 [Verrucomicrobia bacterium SCGC AG-212-E04]|nr:hypothetical protein AYO41_03425 [Verrucomicrobia bacterium SCGC AG-212-E04]